MAVATYTKSGAKATSPAKLDKHIFGVVVYDHQLLKEAYLSYLANGRSNNALAKKRGEIRGGGRKPWRQKGTGNARFGSSRNPIWRGGGVAFGPTGTENYTRKLSTAAKHAAVRQALSLAAKENRISVIDSLSLTDGKTRSAAGLFRKIAPSSTALIVVADKNQLVVQAVGNLTDIKLVTAKYLNVFDIINAGTIIFEKPALDVVHEWLGVKKK